MEHDKINKYDILLNLKKILLISRATIKINGSKYISNTQPNTVTIIGFVIGDQLFVLSDKIPKRNKKIKNEAMKIDDNNRSFIVFLLLLEILFLCNLMNDIIIYQIFSFDSRIQLNQNLT